MEMPRPLPVSMVSEWQQDGGLGSKCLPGVDTVGSPQFPDILCWGQGHPFPAAIIVGC